MKNFILILSFSLVTLILALFLLLGTVGYETDKFNTIISKEINKNYPKAYLWWRLALDQNANGAVENLNTLQKIIDSKDLSKGVSLYNKCLKILLRECLK